MVAVSFYETSTSSTKPRIKIRQIQIGHGRWLILDLNLIYQTEDKNNTNGDVMARWTNDTVAREQYKRENQVSIVIKQEEPK